MSLLSWNCQGLGRFQDLVISRLKEMRKEHFSEVLFPMETMNKRNVLVDLQEWLGYDMVHTIEPIGRRGGLALFWKNIVEIDFLFTDKNLVDIKVMLGDSSFFASCIYGDPSGIKLRSLVWQRLSRIGVNRKEEWCIFGDFNDIIHGGEKIGGPDRNDGVYGPFNDMLRACGMSELPSTGNSFTWVGRGMIFGFSVSLIDALEIGIGFLCFQHLINKFWKKGSDHRPVLISLILSKDYYRGSFRFDRRFFNKPRVKETILASWNIQGRPGQGVVSVAERLRVCRKALSKWKKENNVNSRDKIAQLQIALERGIV